MERLAWGSVWIDSGLVFTREDGAPLHPDTFSKMFTNLAMPAGVRTIRLHHIRHGYASMALKAGTHPKVVQQRLGHSSILVTRGIYSMSWMSSMIKRRACCRGQWSAERRAQEPGLNSDRRINGVPAQR